MDRQAIEINRRKLRNVFEQILKENPQGVLKQRIWELVTQKLHQSVSPRDYGIRRMSHILEQFSDLFYRERRDSQTYLIPGSPDYIIMSSISDESDDSDMEFRMPSNQNYPPQSRSSMAPPPPKSTSVSRKQSPDDWKSSRTQRQVDKLMKLKANLVTLLKAENGAISKKNIWNIFNKRFLNPKTSDFGIKKMDEVFPFFQDVVKQDGEKIVLKQPTGSVSKVAAKSSTGLAWGQGVGAKDSWGVGATAANPAGSSNSNVQRFVSRSSSSDSLNSIDDYPNISGTSNDGVFSAQNLRSRDSSINSRDPNENILPAMRHGMRPDFEMPYVHGGGPVGERGGPMGGVGRPMGGIGGPMGGVGGPMGGVGGPMGGVGGPIGKMGGPMDERGAMMGGPQGLSMGGRGASVAGPQEFSRLSRQPVPLMSLFQQPVPAMGSYSQLRGMNTTGPPLVFLGSSKVASPAKGPEFVTPPLAMIHPSAASGLVQPPQGMGKRKESSDSAVMDTGPIQSDNRQSQPSSSTTRATKIEEDSFGKVPRPAVKKEVNVKPCVLNRGEYLSFDQIDSIAKDCIDILADAEEYVSPERIEQLLLKRFSRNSLRELNSNLRHTEQIKSINEHIRLLNKVNLYVHAFVKCRCICTVHELLHCMKEFTQDDTDFKSLRVGPIQKLPVVYDLFKFPAEAEVLEITTIDVLEHLRKYMDVKQKWVERLDMEDVMQYLVDHYGVDSAYELGLRIRSLPLSVQVTYGLTLDT